MNFPRKILSLRICLPLILALATPTSLLAADAVNVTIEADDTSLSVGQSTTVRVYGQIDGAIEATSFQILSWYIDVLNDNGSAVAIDAMSVTAPASDNNPPPASGSGTPDGANMRGIFDSFIGNLGAGKGSRVILAQFEVTANALGTSTLSVAAGTTLPLADDFVVPQSGGGAQTGGNYSAASVAITVSSSSGVDLTGLDLSVERIGTQADITFNPVPGASHTVQYSDTMAPGSWTDLPGAPHNSGNVSQTVTGISRRCYRVAVTPP